MPTLTRTSAVAGVLLAGLVVGAPAAEAATTSVLVYSNYYKPASVTILKGGAVKWTNKSFSSHTVTADSGAWSLSLSRAGTAGSSKSRTFLRAGTYKYHCKLHSAMRGTVVVK